MVLVVIGVSSSGVRQPARTRGRERPGRVDRDVPFAAVSLLSRIESTTRLRYGVGSLHRLGVDDRGRRQWSAPVPHSGAVTQCVVDALPHPRPDPAGEDRPHGGRRRELRRQFPPCDAASYDIEDCVENYPTAVLLGAPLDLRCCRKMGAVAQGVSIVRRSPTMTGTPRTGVHRADRG